MRRSIISAAFAVAFLPLAVPALAQDRIALPVSALAAVIGLGRTLVNRAAVGDAVLAPAAAVAQAPGLVFDVDPQFRFQLGGVVGDRIVANNTGWLTRAPMADPGLLAMFQLRDRQPTPNLVPWAGEFVGKYLEIEQTRFHDRLKVHMDVPPDLLAIYVPSLALQPLVENAIKHGVSVDSAAGRLEIAAKCHNGRVRLCIRDDGPGPTPGSRLRFGVGLTNVQSRLKQLYGDESSLELTGGDGRGCEAIITIPLRSSHEDASPHRR